MMVIGHHGTAQDMVSEGAPAIDCLIVGAGPAGLTAAIYLGRFHLSVLVVDAGESRAGMIPRTRNHAGYRGGIPGKDLLWNMARQAEEFGARLTTGCVTALTKNGNGFDVRYEGGEQRARSVLLATGVYNRRPPMSEALHDEALARGLLRYCPVCDGFEVTDTKVAVIGSGSHGLREALFLRSFTADLTLVAPDGPHVLAEDEVRLTAQAAISLVDGPISHFEIEGCSLCLSTSVGRLGFASVYPALGSEIRSGLGRAVGAELSDEGCLLVDAHQRTSCKGLYAAGDVVIGLDQISHAMGEGGVAATTIRNDLASIRPLYRAPVTG
jgi:thioredoxin reductase (NADPH)